MTSRCRRSGIPAATPIALASTRRRARGRPTTPRAACRLGRVPSRSLPARARTASRTTRVGRPRAWPGRSDGRWQACGTASTSRSTPTRCCSWVRSTPRRSPTKAGAARISRAICTRTSACRSTRSLPSDDHGEGTNLRFSKSAPARGALVAKFPSIEEIHIVVAGGTAGRFSMAIPGWLGTRNGSRPLTRLIESN